MSQKRVKKKGLWQWYLIVANALKEQKTFSILESKYGSRFIYQEIAHYLLRESDETAKCKSFNYYCRKVRSALSRAIEYLESEGIAVRRTGATNRVFDITIDPDFPDAQKEDFVRIEKRSQQILKGAQKHIKLACPRLEDRFNKSTTKLLTGE